MIERSTGGAGTALSRRNARSNGSQITVHTDDYIYHPKPPAVSGQVKAPGFSFTFPKDKTIRLAAGPGFTLDLKLSGTMAIEKKGTVSAGDYDVSTKKASTALHHEYNFQYAQFITDMTVSVERDKETHQWKGSIEGGFAVSTNVWGGTLSYNLPNTFTYTQTPKKVEGYSKSGLWHFTGTFGFEIILTLIPAFPPPSEPVTVQVPKAVQNWVLGLITAGLIVVVIGDSAADLLATLLGIGLILLAF